MSWRIVSALEFAVIVILAVSWAMTSQAGSEGGHGPMEPGAAAAERPRSNEKVDVPKEEAEPSVAIESPKDVPEAMRDVPVESIPADCESLLESLIAEFHSMRDANDLADEFPKGLVEDRSQARYVVEKLARAYWSTNFRSVAGWEAELIAIHNSLLYSEPLNLKELSLAYSFWFSEVAGLAKDSDDRRVVENVFSEYMDYVKDYLPTKGESQSAYRQRLRSDPAGRWSNEIKYRERHQELLEALPFESYALVRMRLPPEAIRIPSKIAQKAMRDFERWEKETGGVVEPQVKKWFLDRSRPDSSDN